MTAMKNMASTSSHRRAAGFTLIELLVVIGIIVTLASLILPGIITSQEEARRMQCLNHLKQMGMAAIAYRTSHAGAFPPGYLGPNPVGQIASPYAFQYVGLHGQLLTYLGKDNLADRMDINLDISQVEPKWWGSGKSTEAVAKNKFAEFMCPSAFNQTPLDGAIVVLNTYSTGTSASNTPAIEKYELTPAMGGQALAITNYLGVSGVWGKTGNTTFDKGAGIFGNRSRSTVIKDGDSMTLLFGEATNESGRKSYAWMGAGCLPVGPRREFVSSPQTITNPNDWRLFSSYHRGGVVNFCFADGSCRSLSMDIDQSEFEALAGVNDGIPVDLSIFH
jgi:prepilin-type N-terminal cleavage/methylation domain-containing protein/prepilin-type processing-associated H-X9-DG protein